MLTVPTSFFFSSSADSNTSQDKLLSTLEALLFRNVSVNEEADTVKVVLLKPQVIQENPHYYLDLALGASAGLYKSGDHEAAVHILNDVLQLDGMDEVECADPREYCHTLTPMEVLMVLCLMKMEIPSLAFDYIEAAVQNIDTYLSEEQLYITLSNTLMDLAHTIVS